MKRAVRFVPALAVALGIAWSGSAVAQDQRLEFALGLQYPLLSQRTEIQQDIDFRFSFLADVSERFSIGLVYEKLQSDDDLQRTARFPDDTVRPIVGTVNLELYGIEGQVALSGEEIFQIYLVAGLGRGSIDFDGSLPDNAVLTRALPAGLVDRTDISLWYEFGAGFRIRVADRWRVRLQLTGRTMEPEHPSTVLRKAETALVPTASIGFRF